MQSIPFFLRSHQNYFTLYLGLPIRVADSQEVSSKLTLDEPVVAKDKAVDFMFLQP